MENKHKEQYKVNAGGPSNSGPASEVGRAQRRLDKQANRKERRDDLLSSKRMRFDHTDIEENDFSAEEMISLTKQLSNKSSDKESILKRLRLSFSQGTSLIDSFLSVDNSLACLIGLLTGLNPDVQLEACWCLTNMAAGTDSHAAMVAKHAGAYLVTFLSSGNTLLQDQCAWALGNVAGGGSVCRSTVKAQGVLPPLIKLLESPVLNVVRSASFALSNLARDQKGQSELISADILPRLVALISRSPTQAEGLVSDYWGMISEACWVLTYLAATVGGQGAEGNTVLSTPGLIESLVQIIIRVPKDDGDYVQVLTPALRCMGNVLCGLDESRAVRDVSDCPGFLPALHSVLKTAAHPHLHKETLWLLSNLSVFSKPSESMISEGLLSDIINLVQSSSQIRHEAMYCLCNVGAHGSSFCDEMLRHDVLSVITPHIKLIDPDIARLGLALVDMILTAQPQACSRFEECGGLTALEALEYCDNESLRAHTCHILDVHFYNKEETEVDYG